jgi:hypothetical protein
VVSGEVGLIVLVGMMLVLRRMDVVVEGIARGEDRGGR